MRGTELQRVEIRSRAQWRSWLEQNHGQQDSIWLVSFKKHVGNKYVPQTELIDEALCFGWIDSLPRKLDDDRTMLRFSPRSSNSAWSKVNKEKAARLIEENRMHPAGLASIQTAKEKAIIYLANPERMRYSRLTS